jgi:hypothetical protein
MASRTWNRVVARTLLLGVLCAAIGLPASAVMAAPAVDLNADQRALIEQLTADKALAVARERRIAADEQEALNRELDAQDRKLRAADARASGNAAGLARVRKERDRIARQRQELVAALAERDRTLAAEVRAYREIVTGLATSPDPRKLKALQRFADGEQREALDDFDEITRANDAARDKAAAIAKAADRRPIAWLALQARDNGKVTLEQVPMCQGRWRRDRAHARRERDRSGVGCSGRHEAGATKWRLLQCPGGGIVMAGQPQPVLPRWVRAALDEIVEQGS